MAINGELVSPIWCSYSIYQQGLTVRTINNTWMHDD